MVLPVTFDKLTASFTGAQLLVKWNTLSEKANDHFDIEISTNGEIFKKIGTTKTNAPNGDSSTELSYRFTLSTEEMALSAGFLFSLVFTGFFRRRKQYMTIAVMAGALLMISCNKWQLSQKADADTKYFIRLAQIDTDGKKAYSKTVQVIYQ